MLQMKTSGEPIARRFAFIRRAAMPCQQFCYSRTDGPVGATLLLEECLNARHIERYQRACALNLVGGEQLRQCLQFRRGAIVRRQIPYPSGLIVTAGNHRVAVGAKSGLRDRGAMLQGRRQRLPGSRVPNARRVVLADSDDPAAVGAEGGSPNPLSVS